MVEFSHAIIFVSDMARSIAFYRDVLGLPLRFESSDWTEFDTPGSTLALHLADDSSTTSSRQNSIQAGACNLGFTVEDIEAFHQTMVAKGVTCLQPPEVEDFGGKLAGYADPDGLPFWINDKPKKP
ncbi:MAG: VOC family protein [Planctomycetota bacterium]